MSSLFQLSLRLTGLVAGSLAALASAAPASATQWPDGAKAAVVLTYDDALVSQLDNVVPVLSHAGLHGTFFLSNVRMEDVPRWRAAAAAGDELANHTIFHPCARADFAADPRYVSEAYTAPSMLREIMQADVLLAALDGKSRHGFASPCGETRAGGVDYLDDLRRSGLVTYVRGVSTSPADLRADVSAIDPMHIPAQGFSEGATLDQLIDLTRRAEAGGGWAVYLFHGVGGDHLRVDAAVHAQFIAWLAAHKGEVWTATLQEALDWAKRNAPANAPSSSGRGPAS